MTTFRACYYLATDGQSDILLTGEGQSHLSDDALLDAAMAEADSTGLPQHLVDISESKAEDERHLTGEDSEPLTLDDARDLIRRQLRIGDYNDR